LKQCIGDATLALKDFANNIEVVGDKAKMQQKDVLPIGTFARMEDTPYAWALAFPTLFPPTFRKNKSVILGDLTSPPSSGFRDRKVPLPEWVKWMMWNSNGQAAKHPFFALVLNSELTRKGRQSQGRVTLSCNDMPPDMTIEAFRKHWNTPKGQQLICNALNFGAGMFAVLSQYWANANRQFIDHYSHVGEFAKGRGAIHTHGTGYSNTAVDQEIDDLLVKLAIDSYWALREIDEFIYVHLKPEDRLPSKDDKEPTNPLEIVGKEGMDARRQFLSTSPEQLQTLKNFADKLDAIKRGNRQRHLV
jgi:hypothetical protein